MTNIEAYQFPPPRNWQDFEDLCLHLWRVIWKDPNTAKNGRGGQEQDGVDISGRPNQRSKVAGVQCKGKDNYGDAEVTKDDLKEAVAKAKKFRPKLSQFILATSGRKDAQVERYARELTKKHREKGLFSVYVRSWDDIKASIAEHAEVKKYYQERIGLPVSSDASRSITDHPTTTALANPSLPSPTHQQHPSSAIAGVSAAELQSVLLSAEHQAGINFIKELISKHNLKQALEQLEALKKRLWATASPSTKYQVLTNIAKCRIGLFDEITAAPLLIEALQYSAHDDKALTNAAVGHRLLKNDAEARTLLHDALDKNRSFGNAYAQLIHVESSHKSFDELVALVPPGLFDSLPEISGALGVVARNQGIINESITWLRRAVAASSEDDPDYLAALGDALYSRAIADRARLFVGQVDEDVRKDLAEAVSLIDRAWLAIQDSDLAKQRAQLLVVRGLAKSLLGDINGALADVEHSIQLKSTLIARQHRASLLFQLGRQNEALKELTEIPTTDTTFDVPLLRATILRSQNNRREALAEVTELLKTQKLPDSTQLHARELEITLSLDIKDFDRALLALDDPVFGPLPTLKAIYGYRITAAQGDKAIALEQLKDAYDFAKKDDSIIHRILVADALFEAKLYTPAAELYRTVKSVPGNDQLTTRTLLSEFHGGILENALGLCRKLNESSQSTKVSGEIEVAIYQVIGDLENAEKAARKYLSAFPTQVGMRVRLANTLIRGQHPEEADSILDHEFDWKEIDLSRGWQLASVYIARGQYDHALRVLYELRRNHGQRPEAHMYYISFRLQEEPEGSIDPQPTVVAANSAVHVRDKAGREKWYILDDRGDADPNRSEMRPGNPLAVLLLGKSIGDDVIVNKGPVGAESLKILNIKSKYLHALHESLADFPTQFPQEGMFRVQVSDPPAEGAPPGGLSEILETLSHRRKGVEQVSSFYKQGLLTISAAAETLGVSTIEAFRGFKVSSDFGITCAVGIAEVHASAASRLDTAGVTLILDLVALLTITSLGLESKIQKAFPKMSVVQATIDEMREHLHKLKRSHTKKEGVLVKDGDKLVMVERTKGDIEAEIRDVNRILDWVYAATQVIPSNPALRLSKPVLDQYGNALGEASSLTAIAAAATNTMFWSDDLLLRRVAESEFGVDGVWTQAVLRACIRKGVLNEQEYQKATIALAQSHYRFIHITAASFLEAARQANWQSTEAFRVISRVLNKTHSKDDPAADLAAEALLAIWNEAPETGERQGIAKAIVEDLCSGRDRKASLVALDQALGAKPDVAHKEYVRTFVMDLQ